MIFVLNSYHFKSSIKFLFGFYFGWFINNDDDDDDDRGGDDDDKKRVNNINNYKSKLECCYWFEQFLYHWYWILSRLTSLHDKYWHTEFLMVSSTTIKYNQIK